MALTEEMKAEGWIEWHGGLCPVASDSKPGVLFRDGTMVRRGAAKAKAWWVAMPNDCWRHRGRKHEDIVAYLPEARL